VMGYTISIESNKNFDKKSLNDFYKSIALKIFGNNPILTNQDYEKKFSKIDFAKQKSGN